MNRHGDDCTCAVARRFPREKNKPREPIIPVTADEIGPNVSNIHSWSPIRICQKNSNERSDDADG